jgi:GNAT superfamily N-acetyltransferase
MTIRLAVPADLERLVAGNQAMARETEGRSLVHDRLRAGVAAVLEHPARGRYWVWTDAQERVQGQLMITTEWSDWRNAPIWWLQSVYVWPEHRRKGVFAALHAHVEAEAQREGAAGLRLYVERDNAVAQRTYARLGMTGSAYRMYERMF